MRKLIKKILKESDDFDWVRGVHTYYKVEQLEVGKMYEFEPDYSIMGKWEGYDDFPSWISDYEGRRFYIIKQEPKPRFPKSGEITFKPVGDSNKMVYDGKYVKLPYNARIFLWGKFKEVDTPEFVTESNDFDWLSDYEFDVDRVKVGDTFKTVGGNTWFEVDKIKWNKTIPELSMVYTKRPDEGWENQFYFKDIIKGLNTGRLDYDPNALEKIETKEIKESNDFDWAKETNPIQCKDLRGYYFNYGSDTKKYTIISIELDDYADELIIHYKYPNSSEYEHNHMKCDTFIHRVKIGNYTLYDKNGVEVNPKDLVYTDNTFNDDERKEIWEQDESDDFDWVRDIEDYNFQPRDMDYIEVINLGSEKSFLDWLSDYSEFYIEGLFGPTIKGKVFFLGGNTFQLDVENENSPALSNYTPINFPTISSMDTFGNSDEYSGLKLMYRPLMGDGRTT